MRTVRALARRIRDPRWDRVVLMAAIVMFAVARAGRFEERDPYWQVRAGAENLAGLPLARPDSWSWSPVAGDWYQNSAGWNDVLALAFQGAGYWGIFAVTAVMIAVYLSLVAVLAGRFGARVLPGMAGLVVLVAGTLSMLSPRATLVIQVLILAAVALTDSWARSWARRFPIWVTGGFALVSAGAISAFGNWVHLSFLTFAPVGALGIGLLWCLYPIGAARKVLAVLGGAVGWLGGLATSAYGIAVGLERTSVVQQACAGLILEWSSPFQAGMDPKAVVVVGISVLLALAVAYWLVRRWRSGERCASEPALAGLALFGIPVTLAGLLAVRFIGVGLLSMAPVVAVAATGLTRAVRRWAASRPPSRWREYTEGSFWRPVISAVTVVLLPGTAWLGWQHAVPVEQPLVDLLPANCRLMNSQTVAGPVILSRPDVKVWIDGRADYFGRDHLELTYSYYRADQAGLVPTGTTCVLLLDEMDLPMADAMERSPDWRLAGQLNQYKLWLPSRG